MGKLSRGFLGGFQGQLGTAYGCFWRLMDLIKAMPRKSNKPPTTKQLDQQLKWALVTDFCTWLTPIVKVGYQGKPANQSAVNAAVGYNLKNAVTGVAPNYVLDYPNVKISNGVLQEANTLEMENVLGSKLKFSWLASELNTPNTFLTDKASFVVYNPLKHKFVMLQGAAQRDDLEYTVQLPLDYVGDTVKCYVMLVREDGKMVSNSQFAGSIEVI